jgi:hypothetical protein
VSTIGKIDRVEGHTSVQPRRRWTAEEKTWIVLMATYSARPRSISRTAGVADQYLALTRVPLKVKRSDTCGL